MNMRRRFLPLFFAGFALASCVLAEGEADSPAGSVHLFHEALASGDKAQVLELLDPGVVIFESGGAELSRDEYASHHLAADMEFSAAMTREVVEQTAHVAGETAWVLTRSTSRGTFHSQEFDVAGVETMLLRRAEGGWRIQHIHWSSRRRQGSHE